MKKILILKDNHYGRDSVCASLELTCGIPGCRHFSGALGYLYPPNNLRPDLLSIEISFPGIDCIKFVKRVKSKPHFVKIPAFALTAHTMEENRHRFMTKGFDSEVREPLSEKSLLLESVSELIHRWSGEKR